MNEYLPLINNMIKENRSTYEADYKMFGPWLERYKKSALEKYGLELGQEIKNGDASLACN